VLLVILAHDLELSIQAQGWIYMGVWLAVDIGLVVFDWKAWRAPATTVLPGYADESRVRKWARAPLRTSENFLSKHSGE
jgi:hypothetical protein